MKRIKGYKEFRIERTFEENIFSWISDKFKQLKEYLSKLKGKALVGVISSFLPKELVKVVYKEAGVAVTESFLFEEIRPNPFRSFESPTSLTPEQIDNLSEEEYLSHLKSLSDSVIFDVDIEGNMAEDDKKIYQLLVDNGIPVNQEIIAKQEKSVDNIYSKIEELKIPSWAKKTLRVSCLILLFGLIAFKGTTGYAAELPDSEKFVKIGGDEIKKSSDDDPRTLWDKLTGKKVSTLKKKITSDFKTTPYLQKKGVNTADDYVKYLQSEKGYKLDSFKSDTLHKILHVEKPDTAVQVAEANIEFVGADKFETAKFELSPEVKSSIENQVDSIKNANGIITNYYIESSTDKEPSYMKYAGKTGNEALAQKRADVVKDVLTELGEDSSIVQTTTKPDQGPDVFKSGIPKSEARERAKDSRYTKLFILFYIPEDTKPSEDTTVVDKVVKTWNLSKKVVTKPGKRKIPPFRWWGFPNRGNGGDNVGVCKERLAKKFDF